jgi:hypothetical protein
MKNSLIKLAGAFLLALGLATITQADPLITGQIHIDAFAATSSVDFTTHTITFNGTIPGANSLVTYVTGDYTSLLGAAANYSNFTYQPFVPQVLWTITLTPTTYFVLNAVTVMTEVGDVGVSLTGSGTAYMLGHGATSGVWTFSSSRNPGDASFNFSSSTTAIPDGGTTALLVGLGLAGVGLVASRRKKV